MFPTLSRRTRGRYARASALGLLIVLLLDLFSLLSQYHTFKSNLHLNTISTRNDLPGAVRSDKIYIQAQFWTSALALYNGWSDTLLELVQVLGKEKVFVSIVESGSLDNTKEFLQYLDYKLGELGIERSVMLSDWSHADELNRTNEAGVFHFPEYAGHNENDGSRREWEVRRIPFLARERNRGLEPLVEMGKNGKRFDKILVLNDVVFRPEDVLSLLGTREGRYSAACALDFHYANEGYYDTFALRDSEGRKSVQRTFPYFRSGDSRAAMLKGMPGRAKSCWNGMVVMDAAPFYSGIGEAEPGLRYRGIEDSLAELHVEGSECCLIWADMEASGDTEAGIWVNPAVRVGYVQKAYEDTHFGVSKDFLTGLVYVKGIWINRFIRWIGSGMKQPRAVKNRVAQWKKEGNSIGEERKEVGEMCLIDEMHVLIWNGWKHL
jgi:hypothetical protein